MNRKKIIIFVSAFILISSLLICFKYNIPNKFEKNTNISEIKKTDNTPKSATLWKVNFIHVKNNWTITNETYPWCNGKGIETDPFVINNVNVTGNGNEIGILIENTRDYFKIINCYISKVGIGIKVINATYVNICYSIVNNIQGFSNRDCQGILISNCSNACIFFNNLSQIFAANGIDGINLNEAGGVGFNAYGILVNNSKHILINSNNILNIYGGNGGYGRSGSSGQNAGENGHHGGNGGNGGNAFGIFIESSFNISNSFNHIWKIKSGNGSYGGGGGNGCSANPLQNGGFGGSGGYGGDGGLSCGIFCFFDINLSVSLNQINNITSGYGGSGGKGNYGGDGGEGFIIDGGDGGGGGWGGKGGNGGPIIGIGCRNVKDFLNVFNLISNITSGNGGNGGNGYRGGDGGDPGGHPGSPGRGGNGGNGGLIIGIDCRNVRDFSNVFNYILNFYSGNGGIKGIKGYWPSGGSDGNNGIPNIPHGFDIINSNYSTNFLNTIHCNKNVDSGNHNRWDNGTIGNYWSNYHGVDMNPYDGIGDTNYTLDEISVANDTKPIIYPMIIPLNDDFDHDGLSNFEEYFFGIDGCITNSSNPDTDYDNINDFWEWKNQTNPLNKDTDGDGFGDDFELTMGTKPTDKWWHPMPNLKVVYFKNILAYNNQSIVLDFSIQNNGIWKAENIIVIITCESERLTLYNNSKSPFSLDVDQSIIIQNISSLIKATGTYTLNITIDPDNSINETYSSKDGSFRLNNEFDNTFQVTLTIIQEINQNIDSISGGNVDDDDNENIGKEKENLFDEKTIIITAVVSTIWGVSLIIVFTSQKIKLAKQKDLLRKKLLKTAKR